MYGTAWKEEKTKDLTLMALRLGCRAFDTANQRKHYYEAAMGDGLRDAYRLGLVRREDLFLQTKFTYLRGQDQRLPYDPKAPLNIQVEQSFASSQEHLGTDVIDSYVLHGPSSGFGLTNDDRVVWRTMENIHGRGKIKHLGLSNVSYAQLCEFYEFSITKPTFVQNRCYASSKWDLDIRDFCRKNAIIYQGFSLLTANMDYLGKETMRKLAQKKQATIAQLVFRFSQLRGMLPLTGTTSPEHLESDLRSVDINLLEDELLQIENIAWLD
jgi:diketogulonate reductase-like aldo/keto reductase